MNQRNEARIPVMKVNFCNVQFRNPTVLASGILGVTADTLKRVSDCGAAGLTLKSIGPRSRYGHKNPTILPFGEYTLNSVGLPTQGYKDMEEKWVELEQLKKTTRIIASIYGGTVYEFVEITEFIAKKKPELIELNLSCPHTEKVGTNFATDMKVIEEVIKATKEVSSSIPIIPKLSPNVISIAKIAEVCEDAGADGLCAINTLGPGMAIDIESRKPMLGGKVGGLSGPALRPIAVKCVYDIHEVSSLPIIGTGGITYGKDAIEMMMAGATLVGIGTGVYHRGIDIFSKVCDEMQTWMQEHDIKKVEDIIGVAHEK